MLRPRPFKGLRQQRQHQCDFIGWLLLFVTVRIQIIRLVPNIPGQDSLVVCKGPNDAFDVSLQTSVLGRILERLASGALYPAGIVNTGCRRPMHPQFRHWVPARIEENEYRPDFMPGSDLQEGIDALPESRGILLPK